MLKRQINRKNKKIKYELFVNKPDVTPYPPETVKRRKLLLFAQIHLSKILEAKKNKNSPMEELHTKLYRIMMEHYYGWQEIKKYRTSN